MKITIEEIGREQDEEIILRCHEINDNLFQVIQFLY